MTQEEFNDLVKRLEGYARKHPAVYKLRLGLLAGLGYAYLFGVVALLLLLIVVVALYTRFNYLIIKVLWIPLGIVAVVLRSLWIQFPEPEGHELKQEDAPRLFAFVREVRKAAQGPRVHHVLLTDEFNAGIVQIPRLGVFGWHRNYLTVGLLLMEALSPDEFRAVLAHEFGHLSGRHGHFSAWIYRVRHTWIQLLTTLQRQKRTGYEIFERFFNWYAPFFGAYSFVLARTHEYEADRRAVELAGKEHAAQSLISLELKDRLLKEQFWPSFYKQADQLADPPKDPLTQVLSALHQPLDEGAADKWFGQSLKVRTSSDDTHPSLADRLAAMGYAVASEQEEELLKRLVSPQQSIENTAAHHYLDAIPEDYLAKSNRLWREAVAQTWRERHKFVQEAQATLETLREKEEAAPLTIEERWEQARLLTETQGSAVALPILSEVIATQPDHAGANYLIGQILLAREDETGVQHIERAMQHDPAAVLSGCEQIYFFLRRRGRHDQADQYRVRAAQHNEKLEKAWKERQTIYPGDEFRSPGLEAQEIERLRDQLSNFAQIRTAYLVRKVLHYFPEEPLYVLGIIPQRPWYKGRSVQAEGALIKTLADEIQLPAQALVISLEGNRRHLRKVFSDTYGAEIWRS